MDNATNLPANDEISLVDLIRILVRRKRTLFLVFGVCVATGLLLALLLPKKYQYSTTIEIGSSIVKDDLRLIDEPETIQAKINESYIPVALQHHHERQPDDDTLYEIKARIPKKSQIVVIEARGTQEQAETYKALQNDVIQQVVKDHGRLSNVIRKGIENAIEKSRHHIESLNEDIELIKARLKRIDTTIELVRGQIKTSKSLVEAGIRNREKASQRVRDEARAMTLLMIDNEIQQNRRRADELDERLTVKLANEKDQVINQLAEKQRKISEAQSSMARQQLQLKNLRDTHALVPPMQSLEPVSLRKAVILALAVVLGGIMALFAAFMHEFVINTREAIKSESQPGADNASPGEQQGEISRIA